MPTLNVANVIQGPAIITFNGNTYYTKGDIKVKHTRNTFDVDTSMHGKIDERMKSQSVEISFQPVGAIEDQLKYFPYVVADIGKSIFGATDKTLAIKTLAGKVITWERAAVSKLPPIRLKATDTLFGDMSFLCLGKSNAATDSSAFWNAVTTAAFNDATFDETLIKTAHYTAAYGSAPFNAMEALDGFEIEPGMTLQNIEVDAYGIVDAILTGLTVGARFTPVGLTEENIYTLMALQNTGALVPGESLTKTNTALVITSAALVVTLAKAGPKSSEFNYGLGKTRLGQIEFVSRRTWNAGVGDELFTLEIPE